MFSGQTIDKIVKLIESTIPGTNGMVHAQLKKQREKLHTQEIDENKHFIALIWDWVILAMVTYFLISIVNSSVNDYLVSYSLTNRREKQKKRQERMLNN